MQAVERILVVEDGELLAGMLKSLLEDEGFEVVLASSVGDAVKSLERDAFSLILTDSFSGTPAGALEETQILCKLAAGAPVALMTGYRVNPEEALARGFCDVIPKPFDLDDLVRRVRDCLSPATPSLNA